MTKKGRSTTREIDMGRGLISPDLGNGEVIHIPGNPIGTKTVHTREGLDEIGTGLPPGNRGNAKTVHILGKIK